MSIHPSPRPSPPVRTPVDPDPTGAADPTGALDPDAALRDLLGIAGGTGTPPVRLLRRLVAEGFLDDIPLPGGGATARRFRLLAEIAAADLSLGRLVEGHLDAVAILAEAGRPHPGCYGVWATERAGGAVHGELRGNPDGERTWTLSGVKPYASGAGELDRALLTAVTPEGPRLFDVDLELDGVTPVPGTWPAVGMADSLRAAVRFDDLALTSDAAVAGPGFYTDRPGFWAGSVGVAACWYGGALGIHRSLVAMLRRLTPARPGQLVHLGATAARCRALAGELTAAAVALDTDPLDTAGRARIRALTVRHLVYEGCQEILDRAGRAGRTAFMTGERALARRLADLPVYLSQHHPDDDLAALGLDALGPAPGTGAVDDPLNGVPT